MNTLPTDVLCKIIDGLTYVIMGLMSVGLSVFFYFHKSLIRRLEAIDADLKPIRTEIALVAQRVDEHEKRITKLESEK